MKANLENRSITATEQLTKLYKSVPGHLAFFAAGPYILTYGTGASLVHVSPFSETKNPRTRMMLGGLSYCAIFTLMPALPVGTVLTIGLSLTAGTLAALSIPITYPIAMVMDKVDGPTGYKTPTK